MRLIILQIPNVLTPRNGNIGNGEEYLSGNGRNITDDGGIVISDVSEYSGIENKDISDRDCYITKQAEKGNKLDNSSNKIVLESHL